MFEDNRRIQPIVWILGGYFLIARIFGFGYVQFGAGNDIVPSVYFFTHVLSETIKIGFLLHSVFLIVKGFDSDLSLPRRRLRIAVASSIGLLTIFMAMNSSSLVFGRFLGSISYSIEGSLLSLWYRDTPFSLAFFSAYIYIVLNLFMLCKMRIIKDDVPTIFGTAPELSGSLDVSILKLKSKEAKLIARIKHAMEIDQVYKEPKLTVADLATRVQIPEYKVRETINTHMKFKNFREFLNSYRISKAEEMLLNEDYSITYIGMDVGFVSLSAFHKIFKDKNNITPREFRIKNKGLNTH
jgi:AraC-like DNA-binding protein